MRLTSGILLISLLGLTLSHSEALAHNTLGQPLEKAENVQEKTIKGLGKNAFSDLEKIDLSEAQQIEIDDIQADMANQLSEILTDEQMEKFTAARANNSNMRNVMRSLGLTSSQRSSVRSLMEDTQSQIMDVLTAEQRAELEDRPRDR